ncbi:MAG: thiamine pyrophosphate-dependent enzyme [Chloroflexota bacterium]
MRDCGDGSFGMACGELDTIVRLGMPLTIVQFTNRAYGWIKILQKLYYSGRYLSVDFTAPTDAVKIAEGFGMVARRVERAEEVGEAIRFAIAAERPVFLEIPTPLEHDEVPPVRAWLKDSDLW